MIERLEFGHSMSWMVAVETSSLSSAWTHSGSIEWPIANFTITAGADFGLAFFSSIGRRGGSFLFFSWNPEARASLGRSAAGGVFARLGCGDPQWTQG